MVKLSIICFDIDQLMTSLEISKNTDVSIHKPDSELLATPTPKPFQFSVC